MSDILDILTKAVITSAAGAFVGAMTIWVKGLAKQQKIYDNAVKAVFIWYKEIIGGKLMI